MKNRNTVIQNEILCSGVIKIIKTDHVFQVGKCQQKCGAHHASMATLPTRYTLIEVGFNMISPESQSFDFSI